MATSIAMPQLGESVTEGTIGRWLKQVGESVERDEPLVEIITDKVNVEVPSPAAGVVGRILVEEGKVVPVGTEICVLEEPGTAVTRVAAAAAVEVSAPAAAGTPSPSPSPRGRGDVGAAVTPSPQASAPARGADAGAMTRTSPLVKRLALEHGVDLSEVAGTGLGGRVTGEDIQAYIEQRGGTVAAPQAPPAMGAEKTTQRDGARGEDGWRELSPLRRAIGEHMVRSVSSAPHVTTCVEIDVSGMMRLREQAAGEMQQREGFRPSPMSFIAKALVEALREHPILNASFESGSSGQAGVRSHPDINLGYAIGLEHGLFVPVIRRADALSIAGLARALHEMADRARAGKLSPDDMRGGTFTLNNTGSFGSLMSTPILNQGQAGIVTAEAIVKRPVVVSRDGEDSVAIRSIMVSCLTFDHRVLDGLHAGQFMQTFKKRLEGMGPGTTIY